MKLKEIRTKIKNLGNKEVAIISQRFFKTGAGQYGEGDIFIGIRVPVLRSLAKEFQDIDLKEVKQLLESSIHEERLLALLILIKQFAKGNDEIKNNIYDLYLSKTKYINNWDLIDCSAEHIVGKHLQNKNRKPLYQLAKSASMWERRISILATFCFIKQQMFEETLKVSKLLLKDREDLIHKAVGWMLRETGERDIDTEIEFLNQYYRVMPRTMLRYAIEKFPENERQRYLRGENV